MQKSGLIILLTWMLSSCASYYTSNGEKQYLQSHNGVNVVVPPPLTSSNLSHFYDLPAQSQDARVSIEEPTIQN